MKFNREIFFENLRPVIWHWCKTVVTQKQVDGLNFLLAQIERDPIWNDVETVSYALATTGWETAWTFQPIEELGGPNYYVRKYWTNQKKAKELGNLSKQDAIDFDGKGDVQLTGRNNYVKATKELRKQMPELVAEFEQRTGETFDLVKNPHQAKDPLIAYAVMTLGMHQGWFTGKSFSSYKTNKFMNWRRIINGTDHDDEIAALAESIEKALRASFVNELTVEPKPSVIQSNPSNPAAMPSIPAIITQQVQPSLTQVAEKIEEVKEEASGPDLTLAGYAQKAQETVADAKDKIGTAVDTYEQFKDVFGALSSGKDSAKSLWSAVVNAIYQSVWAVFAFLIGLPVEVWIVVAVIVGAIGLLYLYRQISLGKLRELARLELLKVTDFLK